jgi:hypothetical protein
VAPGTTAIVSLQASDTWNSVTISPSALSFSSTDPGPKSFWVSVKAPLYTSCNTVGYVVVTGKVVMYPSTLIGTTQPSEGVTGRIDIAPFYQFSLSSYDSSLIAYLGSEVMFDLSIQNAGNSMDTFSLYTIGCERLINDGFQITFSSKLLDIEELGAGEVRINVKIPNSDYYKNQVVDIEIEVSSEGCAKTNMTPSMNIIFKIDIRNRYSYNPGGNEEPNIINPEQPEETTKGLLPGFETVSVILCILFLVIVFRKSAKSRIKKID